MIISRKHPQIELAFDRIRQRIHGSNTFPITTLFIPVGFISLLMIFVALETNKRIKSLATPLILSGEPTTSPAMWFSIAPHEKGLAISSSDGAHFFIESQSQNGAPQNQFKEFEEHLRSRTKQVLGDVVLANRMDSNSAFVVLSVDESLTYAHVRPVIYALANAGISKYGFEGRVLDQ
ncbi:MAG: hypothetical protein NT027_17705 [Proteobacteria bacterium]|nr:hypothetical protein [Pseudomonadota bacterium]